MPIRTIKSLDSIGDLKDVGDREKVRVPTLAIRTAVDDMRRKFGIKVGAISDLLKDITPSRFTQLLSPKATTHLVRIGVIKSIRELRAGLAAGLVNYKRTTRKLYRTVGVKTVPINREELRDLIFPVKKAHPGLTYTEIEERCNLPKGMLTKLLGDAKIADNYKNFTQDQMDDLKAFLRGVMGGMFSYTPSPTVRHPGLRAA